MTGINAIGGAGGGGIDPKRQPPAGHEKTKKPKKPDTPSEKSPVDETIAEARKRVSTDGTGTIIDIDA